MTSLSSCNLNLTMIGRKLASANYFTALVGKVSQQPSDAPPPRSRILPMMGKPSAGVG
jgi:hypothetical protein